MFERPESKLQLKDFAKSIEEFIIFETSEKRFKKSMISYYSQPVEL